MIETVKTKSIFPDKLLIASLLLYGTSLALPALTIADIDGSKTTNGIETLLMGALSILGGGLLEWLTWLANPLFFLSISLKRKQKKSAVTVSWLATLLAVSFSFWTEILAGENGRMAPIENKGLGYFFWVASLAVWTLGLSFDNSKPTNNSDMENFK